MSNQELDNLFKNKLEEFTQKPTRDLWGEIDEQLEPKKKPPFIWLLGVAASLLLLVSIGAFFYLNQNESIPYDKVLAQNNNDKVNPNLENETQVKIKTPIENTIQEKNTNQLKKVKALPITKTYAKPVSEGKIIAPIEKAEKAQNIASNDNAIPKIENAEDNSIEEIDILKTESEIKLTKIQETDATPSDNTASTSSKSKTLVFDISEFTTESALAKNEEENKKESKLKKIFNIAKDIKEGENGLRELREAKNSLLALGTKNDGNGK